MYYGISALSGLVYLKGLSTKSREEKNNEIKRSGEQDRICL